MDIKAKALKFKLVIQAKVCWKKETDDEVIVNHIKLIVFGTHFLEKRNLKEKFRKTKRWKCIITRTGAFSFTFFENEENPIKGSMSNIFARLLETEVSFSDEER